MDPATAKTLVSAALVASIALFSLVSFRALLAQVVADLRAARDGRASRIPGGRIPSPVPVRVESARRREG